MGRAKSPVHPSRSCLEGSTFVPNPSESIMGVPSTDPFTPRESIRTRSTRYDAPISCMAYLREKFYDSSLSWETSSLLLASWRSKSSKSYDPHFRKWLSGMLNKVPVPFGSIAEVANFLAHLFQQGYQFCSLNAYRSTISSVQDRGDGMKPEKHPMATKLMKGALHARC